MRRQFVEKYPLYSPTHKSCASVPLPILEWKSLNKMDHILVYCLWRLLNLIFLLRDFLLKINKLTSNWVSLQVYNKLQFYSSIKFHPALILSYLYQCTANTPLSYKKRQKLKIVWPLLFIIFRWWRPAIYREWPTGLPTG